MSRAGSFDEAVGRLPDAQAEACHAIRLVKGRLPEIRPVPDREGVVFITFQDGSGAFVTPDGRVTRD